MRVTLTFWNQWIKPRKETTADGTTSLYFGFGRFTWRDVSVRHHPDVAADNGPEVAAEPGSER